MKKARSLSLINYAFALLLATLAWQCGTPSAEQTADESTAPETTAPAGTETALSTPAPPAAARSAEPVATDAIQWVSWDEAVASNAQQPKMLFIDVYTDWCGWCKVMDKQTFTDPEVIKHINQNYYAVKFNAENEPPVTFAGQEFKVVEGGRRGIHTLAYALLEGQLSYPSYVYLNSEFQRINISKGFKPAEPFLEEMKAVTDAYLQ